MNYIKKISLVLLWLWGLKPAFAQDIEQVIHAKPVVFAGGFGVNQVYSPSGISGGSEEQPYQYVLNADASVTLWGVVSVPFSITYSNRTFNKSYPFNQQSFNSFGLSPSYKWIKVHAGYRTMNFSPYSLNSCRFLGGGFELTPSKFQIKAMYGQLRKAVAPDSSMSKGNTPTYARWGSGVAFNYVNGSDRYGFSLFRSSDMLNSLNKPLDSVGIYPEENFVYTLNLSKQIASKLQVALEFAQSYITADSRFKSEDPTFFQKNIYIYKNATTQHFNAYKGTVNYQFSFAQIGVGYERVDPDYKAHGAYYYRNDFENITLNAATAFLKRKIAVNGSIGYEHSNLNAQKNQTGQRIVGQINTNYTINQHFQCGASYSNFQNTIVYTPVMQTANPLNQYDSLKYIQVSQNVMLMGAYNLKGKQYSHTIASSASMMNTNEIVGGKVQDTKVTYYNTSLQYTLGLLEVGVMLNPGLTYYYTDSKNQKGGALGPSFACGKTYLKNKARASLGYSYSIPVGLVLKRMHTLNASNSVSIGKHQTLGFTALWLIPADGGSKKNYSLTLNYGYRF